jgi:two-component system NtrC family sensor kinase
LLSALADYAAIAIENARLYEQVKTSETRYRDLFANAYDLIFSLDRELRITSINNVGPQLIGYSETELVGRALADLSLADSWPTAQRQLANLISGRSIQPFELQLLRRDEETVILEVSARLVHDGGRAESVHCIARNMTERRRLEEQLMRSEKLSAIGQLVAGVAHELNNPLTSISGFTQLMLRDKTMPAQVHEDLTHIYTQAERAGKIVQNLLVFAREHKPQRLLVDLNDVLKSTLSLRAYQLRVDNIKVDLQLDPNLPQTVADPFQLQQVFLNLINNSHQAIVERGDPGVLTLRSVQTASVASENGATHVSTIRVSVGDTGVGISRANLNKIFDPFYTTKPVGQGTGLGLSICFGIIQEHGGRIWAESEIGAGTTMFIELPLLAEATGVGHSPEGNQQITAGEAQIRCRVLVVDDEEPVALLLARLLRDLGHIPTVVTSGTAALDVVRREHFDMVLTDVKMPGMNGFELYQAIKERDPELSSRMAFITGDTMSPATQARIAQAGNPYLAKPFAIERLEGIVRALIAQYPLGQAQS